MYVYQGVANQSVINLISVVGALKHTSPCIIYIIRNGTLTGNVNFTQYSTSSCSAWDTAATAVSFTSNDQLLYSFHLGDTGEFNYPLSTELEEFTLQPGEYVSIAAKSTIGTPAMVTVSLNTREDQ